VITALLVGVGDHFRVSLLSGDFRAGNELIGRAHRARLLRRARLPTGDRHRYEMAIRRRRSRTELLILNDFHARRLTRASRISELLWTWVEGEGQRFWRGPARPLTRVIPSAARDLLFGGAVNFQN